LTSAIPSTILKEEPNSGSLLNRLFFGFCGSFSGKEITLMDPALAERKLQDEVFHAMLEATFPLQERGPDRETTLLALIRATEMLKERFEQELAELRQERD
jgi:hypothetical protein